MAKKKDSTYFDEPTDSTPREPKSPRAISIDLDPSIALKCAEYAKGRQNVSEADVRDVIRQHAVNAANASVADVPMIYRTAVIRRLDAPAQVED